MQYLVLIPLLLLSCTTSMAASERSFREWALQHDPMYDLLWKRLGITPLKNKGLPLLRVYDENMNFVITVDRNHVEVEILTGMGEAFQSIVSQMHGRGKRIPNAEQKIITEEVEHLRFGIMDEKLASDLLYLIEHVNTLDTSESGLDGSYTFFDARSPGGTTTTFEVWSPSPDTAPITAEFIDIIWTFSYFLRLTSFPEDQWRAHDARNFTQGFLHISSIGLTREVAKEHLKRAFMSRMNYLTKIMKESDAKRRTPIRNESTSTAPPPDKKREAGGRIFNATKAEQSGGGRR